MARVRSTARVEREGDETEASETVPISEAMQRSGLVTTEEIAAAGANPTAAEGEGNIEETDSEDDYRIAMPSKPSHLDFGKSTVSKVDLTKMVKAGFFSEDQKKLLRFGGEETTPKPEKDEVVIFKSIWMDFAGSDAKFDGYFPNGSLLPRAMVESNRFQ